MLKIRTVHHLSATGGTVMSRALASLQHVYLLSELNPLAPRPVRFDPIDPLQQFGAQYGLFSDDDYKAAFLERLRPVAEAVQCREGVLVIRDHSHSDWLAGTCRGYSSLLSTIRPTYDTVSIVTLRHPIEAYSSLMLKGWHTAVGNFDAYCGRIIEFLDYFSGSTIFHYEDFVSEPNTILLAMCQALELPFSPDWQTRFRKVTLTGDSGRGSNQPIQPLSVKPISESLLSEARCSGNFNSLATRVGYITNPQELIEKRKDEISRAGVALHPGAELRQSLPPKDRKIAELQESIRSKDEHLDTRGAKLIRSRRTIDLMRQSRSWRLTAPLRLARSFFRKG
jgi:hypothetical protein